MLHAPLVSYGPALPSGSLRYRGRPAAPPPYLHHRDPCINTAATAVVAAENADDSVRQAGVWTGPGAPGVRDRCPCRLVFRSAVSGFGDGRRERRARCDSSTAGHSLSEASSLCSSRNTWEEQVLTCGVRRGSALPRRLGRCEVLHFPIWSRSRANRSRPTAGSPDTLSEHGRVARQTTGDTNTKPQLSKYSLRPAAYPP
ncbi:hypothetical protein AAFF_G00158850 [Aldrovandia affinis]|uniref:Uncharacterized protein n=1 Tax=Aldrovandia affinis TaxID=143900 RepID=A0AAD7RNK8_9TELE|nr:hypothetical protein AAFF_G00158850 [Aldrovandia affinis]